MKKFIRKSIAVTLAASLILSFTGCEKKADQVEGLGGNDSSTASDSAQGGESDQSESADEAAGETSEESVTENNSEKWQVTIEPEDMDFKKITINAVTENYTGANKVVTVQADNFDNAFAEEICGKIFDGEAEPYDYDNKTKKIYDADIKLYNIIKDMYFSEDAGMIITTYPGEEEPDVEIYDDTVQMVEDKIAELESEKEAAPESIENDYSFDGYIGTIAGEEYYMYLGNRNYEEYFQSALSIDYSGRICSIFRSDVSSMFDGMDGFIAEYSPTSGMEEFADPPEDILSAADQFVDQIGFSDYQRSGESGGFYYRKGIDISVFNALDLPTSSYSEAIGSTGYVIKYTLGGTSYTPIDTWNLQMCMYVDNYDAFDYYSFIAVFVNENGVVGAQLVNPLTVKNMEDASSIISTEDVKDVIIENAQDEDSWCKTAESVLLYPEFDTLQLISFPIRSTTDGHEYTFVPTYILYNSGGGSLSYDSTTVSQAMHFAPFMLVNALDGSIIHANCELQDPPLGWMNGNVGYQEFQNLAWERQKVFDQTEDNLDEEEE